ncbi:MAG: RNA polymerase sigma factor, partial [Bacillota bacterium]
NDPHEADDLTQETFLKAFENLAGFRQEASLRTWLSRITLNTYLAKRRKRLKHESVDIRTMPVPDWSGNPERIVIRRELQWCIHHILRHHLPRDYSVVLVLRDLNGFSYEEIAGMLGISVSSVKSRLHRARRAYRAHLFKSGCAGLVKDYTCYCEGCKNCEVRGSEPVVEPVPGQRTGRAAAQKNRPAPASMFFL